MPTTEELQERISVLERELAQRIDAAGIMAKVVNDLNNLLAVMRGHAQLAYEDPSGKAVQDLIQVVLASTTRAEQEIRDALGQGALGPAAAASAQGLPKTPSARILVVDDEEPVCKLMHELLTKKGHEVVVAASQGAALQAAKGKAFDIVFIDLILGQADGAATAAQIRDVLPSAHVVFTSGDPDLEKLQRKAREGGADGIIKKPFDIDDISSLVAHILALPSDLSSPQP